MGALGAGIKPAPTSHVNQERALMLAYDLTTREREVLQLVLKDMPEQLHQPKLEQISFRLSS